jgi:DNA-binding SARP family transcriptional activator
MLVVAPAGYGKTTLLAQYAERVDGDVAWHRTTPEDTDPAQLVASLRAALARAGRAVPRTGSDGLASALGSSGEGLTLVLDDAHLLVDSPAEAELERLLAGAPGGCTAVLASRRPPGLNLCRAELGPVAVVTADDLRFRSWEVEELFRDVYGEPLPPDDIAALTRRTDGWAACLQLFHLSTRSRPVSERRRAVAALAGGARFARAYLARTVLAELPADLRDFLARTAVFEVLTASRCDRLLDGSGAQGVLDRLERLGALTTSDDAGHCFRYHEVLRRHLESALREELGAAPADRWYTRAAEILEGEGAAGEALRAYLRAGHWDGATQLLRRAGRRVIDDGPDPLWDDLLPAELVDEDPWLSTTVARRRAIDGRLADAATRYRRAEELFPDPVDRERTARERRLVELWTGGHPQPHLHWLDRVRAAVAGRPATLPPARPHEPGDLLAAALADLLLGDVGAARALLQHLLSRLGDDDAVPGVLGTSLLPIAARLAHALVALVAGASVSAEADRIAADAEGLGATWFVRQARVLRALQDRDSAELTRIGRECAALGDRWGALLADGAAATADLLAGRPQEAALADVARRCGELGAGSLRAWACAAAAVGAAAAQAPGTAAAVRAAEAAGRAAGIRAAVERLLPAGAPAQPPVEVHDLALPPVRLRCLGGFEVQIGGSLVDWNTVRPRAASAFRMLAVHTPRAVHRETLLQLWPGRPTEQATHSLHVAISSLRSLLAPDGPRGSARMVERRGETYVLVLPPGSCADVLAFDRATEEAQRARRADRPVEEADALTRAVGLYRGELLPEEGTAEWVVAERDRVRLRAALACTRLAELHLAAGNPAEAVAVARRGLTADALADGCWRALITAFDRLGETAAAARARRDYVAVLHELGIPAQRTNPPSRYS